MAKARASILVYPTNDADKNKARVVFRSYNWKLNTPKLDNTLEKNIQGMTSEIQLYLPADFSEQYKSNWDKEDLSTFLVDSSAKGVKASMWEALNSAAESANMKGISNTLAKYNQGETHFPGEFMVFKNSSPMTLSFAFELLPKNEKDSTAIHGIVETFKRQMLPTFQGGTLQFPNIWAISFKGIKGPGHPQTGNTYTDMALIDVVPIYSGGAQTALVFDNEYPVTVKLQLTFQAIKHNYLFSN